MNKFYHPLCLETDYKTGLLVLKMLLHLWNESFTKKNTYKCLIISNLNTKMHCRCFDCETRKFLVAFPQLNAHTSGNKLTRIIIIDTRDLFTEYIFLVGIQGPVFTSTVFKFCYIYIKIIKLIIILSPYNLRYTDYINLLNLMWFLNDPFKKKIEKI